MKLFCKATDCIWCGISKDGYTTCEKNVTTIDDRGVCLDYDKEEYGEKE